MPADNTVTEPLPFDSATHRALRARAAETDRSVAEVVNEAVSLLLAEDREDLAALAERAGEPTLSLSDLRRELETDGAI